MKTSLKVGGIMFQSRSENGHLFGSIPLAVVQFASYQREAIDKHWQSIAANWNVHAARPLALSYRDRQFWCYDGRQTLTAMDSLGFTKSPATCVEGLTYAQEADLFYIHNNVPKKQNGWKKFAAAIEAGREIPKILMAEAARAHLTTPLSRGIDKPKHADITNVATLQEPQKLGGRPLVKKVLMVLDKAWRENRDSPVKEAAKSIDLIRGLYRYLHKHQDVPMSHVIDILREYGPDAIRRLANKQYSKGRIDATQFTAAFEEVVGVLSNFAEAA